jgi:hypothetical protein
MEIGKLAGSVDRGHGCPAPCSVPIAKKRLLFADRSA